MNGHMDEHIHSFVHSSIQRRGHTWGCCCFSAHVTYLIAMDDRRKTCNVDRVLEFARGHQPGRDQRECTRFLAPTVTYM